MLPRPQAVPGSQTARISTGDLCPVLRCVVLGCLSTATSALPVTARQPNPCNPTIRLSDHYFYWLRYPQGDQKAAIARCEPLSSEARLRGIRTALRSHICSNLEPSQCLVPFLLLKTSLTQQLTLESVSGVVLLCDKPEIHKRHTRVSRNHTHP